MTDSHARGPAVGLALALSGVATALASVIELTPASARGDGDNPTDSLTYLAEHPSSYAQSGFALAIGGALLIVAVVGVYRIIGRTSLAYSATSVFGLLSGGLLIAAGVLRMQSVGTVPYIETLNHSWGEAAYLAVHVIGTQGLLSTSIISLAVWLVSLAIVFARRRLWAPVAFALFPAIVLLVLLVDLVFPTFAAGDSGEIVFLGYLASITIGMPLACVAFGVALAFPRVRNALSESSV